MSFIASLHELSKRASISVIMCALMQFFWRFQRWGEPFVEVERTVCLLRFLPFVDLVVKWSTDSRAHPAVIIPASGLPPLSLFCVSWFSLSCWWPSLLAISLSCWWPSLPVQLEFCDAFIWCCGVMYVDLSLHNFASSSESLLATNGVKLKSLSKTALVMRPSLIWDPVTPLAINAVAASTNAEP